MEDLPPVAGTSPGAPKKFQPPLLVPDYPLVDGLVLPPIADPTSADTEQYRQIKTRLEYISKSGERPIGTLVLTSACPGDGKTLTALNLGLVLAQDETKSILIVDADLRKPGLRDLFAHRPKLGLNEVLSRQALLSSVLFRPKGSRLMILPSGARATNPAELLRSATMTQVLKKLANRFDYVLIDTPPVVPFVDADELAGMTDASILIVRAGWTPRKLVAQAVETMSRHRFLGIVLNDVRSTPLDRYYYRYDKHYYRGGGKK